MHYIGQFMVTTLSLVGGLWLLSVWLQQKLGKLPSVPGLKMTQNPLQLEASLRLEPRKTLYVVRHGQQRFLLSSHGDSTQLISTLDAAQAVAVEEALQTESDSVPQPMVAVMQPPVPSGFWERLKLSIEMIAAERFGPMGGR